MASPAADHDSSPIARLPMRAGTRLGITVGLVGIKLIKTDLYMSNRVKKKRFVGSGFAMIQGL